MTPSLVIMLSFNQELYWEAMLFITKIRPDGYDQLQSSGRVVIENDVHIGASCTIDRGVTGDYHHWSRF